MGVIDPSFPSIANGVHWLVTLILGIFVLGAFHEIGRLQRRILTGPLEREPSRLHMGDRFTADLGIPLPSRVFLLFVSHGCSGCVDICRNLEGVDLQGWSLITIVRGHPVSRETLATMGSLPSWMSADGGIPIPSQARCIFDPQGVWFQQLEVSAVPTAMALVGGRLVGQQVGPKVTWFQDVPRERRLRGRETILSTA